MTIKSILIDDEAHNLENLQWLLEQNCPDVTVIGKVTSADEGIALIEQLQPDLVFLDIEMPNKNGFKLLEAVGDINFEVIFVTAYNQYALKAIKFCALDYLMKPLAIPELKSSIARVSKVILKKTENQKLKVLVSNFKQANQQQKIALPTADELFFVSVDDIVRCKSENNYTIFHLTNGKTILVSKTLKDWEELLTSYHFIRTHQSHLINSKHVKSYIKKDGGYILMNNGNTVCLSRHKKEEVLNQLAANKF